MSDTPDQDRNFFSELRVELRQLWRQLRLGMRHAGVNFRNWLRRLRRAQVDYVIIPLSGPLPERAEPPRSFIQRQLPLPPEPLSIQQLNARAQRIADADNVRGVLFLLQGLVAPGLARLQNVRRTMERLREAGKQVIVFTPYLDLAHYYLATAADRIIVPPSTQFEVLGLYLEAVFLKDALQQLGVHADIIQISPYKTAGNIFDKSDITPEQREQLSWILDDNYEMITAGIAAGRGKSVEEVKALIDRAPLFAEEALAQGLVDHLAYEDELAYLLAEHSEETPVAAATPTPGAEVPEIPAVPAEVGANEETGEQAGTDSERPRARLVPWSEARTLLLEKARRPTRGYVGVVSLQGAITTGRSRQPPIDIPIPFIGGAMAGHETINKLLRRAERQREMTALLFHVDSNGGSALASDLIWRQIQRISRKKPVLVYMGNVAASGGYYVGAAAQHIMSQEATLTGSIGVLMGRLSLNELLQKLSINRASLQRGEHADLFTSADPLTEEEREILWEGIVHTYRQFKQVVAAGRDIPIETLDPVAEGRVWTGRQARERQLVDSHGDFVDAVRRAAEMGGLPTGDEYEIGVANLYPSGGDYLPPLPHEAPQELAQEIVNLFLGERARQLSGRPLLFAPFEVRWR